MFAEIMKFAYKWEVGSAPNGGYTNDPDDPGGETKWGISARANPGVDIKNLTQEEANEIYKKKYWKDGWEKLGFPLAACLLDTSINMGMGRALQFLERCEGDYVKFLQLRIAKYKDLITNNPTLKKYERGWMNRVTDLRRFVDAEKDNFSSNG